LFAYTRELATVKGVNERRSEGKELSRSYLLYDEGDEKSRVSRDHFIDDAFVAFFVAYVVAPCRQGYGDGVRSMRWESATQSDVGLKIRGGGGHERLKVE